MVTAANGGMAPTPCNNNNNNNPINLTSNNKRGASNSTAAMMTTATTSTSQQTPQLCASCDRCRSRKTKCDGSRPCGNCLTRYRKVNKCENLEGIEFAAFDCVYSPAKRRGPVPGRSGHSRNQQATNMGAAGGQVANPSVANTPTPAYNFHATPNPPTIGVMSPNYSLNNDMLSLGLEGMQPAINGVVGQLHNNGNILQMNAANNGTTFSTDELKQMLALQQQLLVQQQQMQQQQTQQGMLQQLATATMPGGNTNAQPQGVNSATLMGARNNFNVASDVVVDYGGNNNGNTGLLNMTNFQNFAGQQQQQQFFQQQPAQQQSMGGAMPNQMSINQNQNQINTDDRSAKRAYRPPESVQSSSPMTNTNGLPNSVAVHLPLLQQINHEGALLRSYYELSTNDVLNLPPIPTDEEYCARLNSLPNFNLHGNNCVIMPSNLPTYDQSALHAARFSELALGALANNQVPLALELSNASVMCLRNCVESPSHDSCMYDVARAYLLHGIFRSFRGDTVRYFKYRRVCMTHILQLGTEPRVDALLAAISFHDAWAYLMHNAAEDALPNIDEYLPRLNRNSNNNNGAINANSVDEIKSKYGCCTNPTSVATDPLNQMWMQGSPPVFLNNEACPVSRSLDAFACAVRTCCDQANTQFEEMEKAVMGAGETGGGQSTYITPTTTAVMANENELCGRNIVLSAKSLLEQHAGMGGSKTKKHGLSMVAAAMSAFLENGEEDKQASPSGGSGSSHGDNVGNFTDAQITNLLMACDIIIQHPLLLHSPGPIYHMASNAAILLCHLLNTIYSNCTKKGGSGTPSKVEGILFDELLDTFMTVRKILNIHRKCLPVKLRCHGIPRPIIGPFKKLSPQKPFIELGETLMCLCRGCQGFVLMGCSPCVAAERSLKNAWEHSSQEEQRMESMDNQFGTDLGDMEDLDDNALLDVLSRLTQN